MSRSPGFMGEQTGLMVESVEERDVCVTSYLDFVQFHFEPVHSNLFLLISSYTRASHPNGLLPKKQKVRESCSQQVLWLVGPLPEKCCSMVTTRFDPVCPDVAVGQGTRPA